MISVDLERCTRCSVCLKRFERYCMSSADGVPIVDECICNQCRKCVAICPYGALLVNGRAPERITEKLKIDSGDIRELFRRRRSIKRFRPEAIPREVLADIASMAAYAPNQNKNIEIVVIDDPGIIEAIDEAAQKFVRQIYVLLFSLPPLTWFCSLFSKSLPTLKRKMEYGLRHEKHTVKENTACIFITIGDARVPVTEESAQYMLAAMMTYAESLGVGTCLMDSLKHTINASGTVRKSLGIPRGMKALGVLSAGYAAEKIMNIPLGYEVKVWWNERTPLS